MSTGPVNRRPEVSFFHSPYGQFLRILPALIPRPKCDVARDSRANLDLVRRADGRMGFQRRERQGAAKCLRQRPKTGRLRSLRFSAEVKWRPP